MTFSSHRFTRPMILSIALAILAMLAVAAMPAHSSFARGSDRCISINGEMVLETPSSTSTCISELSVDRGKPNIAMASNGGTARAGAGSGNMAKANGTDAVASASYGNNNTATATGNGARARADRGNNNIAIARGTGARANARRGDGNTATAVGEGASANATSGDDNTATAQGALATARATNGDRNTASASEESTALARYGNDNTATAINGFCASAGGDDGSPEDGETAYADVADDEQGVGCSDD